MNDQEFERKEKARQDAMFDAQFADEPTSDVEYADEPPCKTGSQCTNKCQRCGEINPAEIHTCTPKQPAWHHVDCEGECIACLIEREVLVAYGNQGLNYLLSHLFAPPQREWQGLTDEEIDELAEANLDFNWKDGVEDFARAIEAKLKEKNT